MIFVLIAGSTPGLVARLELNIQGAPGRSCDYFCFVFSQVDVVALLILQILDLLISLTGSGLESVVGKCNSSNYELDQQGDFLKQIHFKVPTKLQGAGSIELRLNGKTISIISIHVLDPYSALMEQKGVRSCAKARRAFAKKFRLGRKF